MGPKVIRLFFCVLLFVFLTLAEESVAFATDAGYEKKYYNEMALARYDAAINVALEWNKSSNGKNADAVFALINAYNANFESKKALSTILHFISQEDYNNEAMPSAYSTLASLKCSQGSYRTANEIFTNISTLYPRWYKRVRYQKYMCNFEQLQDVANGLPESLKANITKSIGENKTSDYFTGAMLSYLVSGKRDKLLELATLGLKEAVSQAEAKTGNSGKISARARGVAAILYALGGDKGRAFEVLGCADNCSDKKLLQLGNDPFLLARFFSTLDDMTSADFVLKTAWSRMKSREQKEQFLKFVTDGNTQKFPWSKLGAIPWVIQEQAKLPPVK